MLKNKFKAKYLAYWWLGMAVFVLASIAFAATLSADTISGFASTKTLARQGVTGSSLTIGHTGAVGAYSEVGLMPVLTTSEAQNTSVTPPSATLRGNISSLNGFPSAIVWFEWGYTPALGTTVGTRSVAAIGDYTYNLAGVDVNKRIYYRFTGSLDAINYGANSSFALSAITFALGGPIIVAVAPTLFVLGFIVASLSLFLKAASSVGEPLKVCVYAVLGLIFVSLTAYFIGPMLQAWLTVLNGA